MEQVEIICYANGRAEMPENSLEAIEHCTKVNPKWRIEMYIRLTADKELILFHDENLIRTTGAEGTIADHTYADLAKYNIGYDLIKKTSSNQHQKTFKIPRLNEVFEKFSESKFLLDIQTSDEVIVPKIIDLIEKYELNDDIVIASMHDHIINNLKSLKPEWTYGAAQKEAKKLIYSSLVYLDQYFPLTSDILMIPKYYGQQKVLTKRIINHVKQHNKKIWVWMNEGDIVSTINTKKEWQEMKELGVDAIFCDAPRLLWEQIK